MPLWGGTSGSGAPTDAQYWVQAAHASLSAEKLMPVIRKAAETQVVNNSTTLVNDDTLVLAVAAGEVWEIDLLLLYNTSAAADIKFAFTVPAGAGILGVAVGLGTTDAAQNTVTDLTTSFARGGAAANRATLVKAIAVIAGTAGNVQLQWAQNALEVSDTKVLTNSVMFARKVN